MRCNSTLHDAGGRRRLQGELAVSRSFGDLPYRSAGLIADPELSRWHTVSPEDDFLILASDGVFEALSEDQVCSVAAATAAGAPLYHTSAPLHCAVVQRRLPRAHRAQWL